MQASAFSSAGPGSGIPQSTGSGTAAGRDDRITTFIGGRAWKLPPAAAWLVRSCVRCERALAERTTCGLLEHRVCSPCLAQTQGDSCPACPQALLTVAQRCVQDASLAAMMRSVELECGECRSWLGSLEAMQEHVRLCQKQQHPCSRQPLGCQWTGLLEARDQHELDCEWRPVPCSHGGCPEQVVWCQRQAHKAVCPYRPAQLGALRTTWDKVQRVQEMYRFCLEYETHTGVVAELSEAFVRDRLQKVIPLVPLLYQLVYLSPSTPESTMTCPWSCGFLAPCAEQLETHYQHCPCAPEPCPYCHEEFARKDWLEHRHQCDRRPAECPQGCGQKGLRVVDIARGWHAMRCRQRLEACSLCSALLPGCELNRHERCHCPLRPVHCCWCLQSHSWRDFDTESSHCRKALADSTLFAGQRLLPHAQATGPVYVAAGGQSDPVYIRLPLSPLLDAITGRASPGVLTPNLSFTWSDVSWQLFIESSLSAEQTLTVNFYSSVTINASYRARVGLYAPNGDLVEALHSESTDDKDGPYLAFDGSKHFSCKITAFNRLACVEGDCVFLKLGPVFSVPPRLGQPRRRT